MIEFDYDGMGNWKRYARQHMEQGQEFLIDGWKYGWDDGYLDSLANEFGYRLIIPANLSQALLKPPGSK